MNVSHLPARPHVTAGCGGFIDITSHAKRIIFSGFFSMPVPNCNWKRVSCVSLKKAKPKKLVQDVAHVTFSGKRAIRLGQQVQYITERCVLELTPDGLLVTEIALY